MRSLDRDRRRCLLGRFSGLRRVENAQGQLTGRNEPSYAAPVEFWPTVAPARGEASGDVFGQRLDYDVALTVDDPRFAISEADILWVPCPDRWECGGDAGKHTHAIARIARTPNQTIVAARKVDVSA